MHYVLYLFDALSVMVCEYIYWMCTSLIVNKYVIWFYELSLMKESARNSVIVLMNIVHFTVKWLYAGIHLLIQKLKLNKTSKI